MKKKERRSKTNSDAKINADADANADAAESKLTQLSVEPISLEANETSGNTEEQMKRVTFPKWDSDDCPFCLGGTRGKEMRFANNNGKVQLVKNSNFCHGCVGSGMKKQVFYNRHGAREILIETLESRIPLDLVRVLAQFVYNEPCGFCSGTGGFFESTCAECDGTSFAGAEKQELPPMAYKRVFKRGARRPTETPTIM